MNKKSLLLVSLLMMGWCSAGVITVDDNGIADFNCIQDAINWAVDGDIIIIQPGTYEEDVNFPGRNIVLTSTNPSNPDIVTQTVIGNDYNHISFEGSENCGCVLTGFQIRSYIFGRQTHATISNCVIQGNAVTCGDVIGCFDGLINNCLIVDNGRITCMCICPAINNCHGLIRNCTIECSLAGPAIIVGANGVTRIENCILTGGWTEVLPQINVEPGGTAFVSYSYLHDLQGEQGISWGHGNITGNDPCFVRIGYWDLNGTPDDPYDDVFFPGDYHLQSEAGRWDSNSSQWTCDSATSLCVDAGNPGYYISSEPLPNGNRINMGAFGGTASASKSPAKWRSIADLNNDWVANSGDLSMLVQYWLHEDQCLPPDLDRSLQVNLSDFAIFASEWQ
jgi:hypothetical protein